jgi:hypothetical protein
MAEVQNIKFSKEFQRNLYPDDTFAAKSKTDVAPAPNVTTVEIPQAAAAVPSTFGAVQAGQANLANANSLTPIVRLNNKLTYDIKVFGTEPTALQGIDLQTISYDKRAELFQEHADVVNEQIANYTAIQWAQETANTDLIINTTDTATRTSIVTGGYAGLVKRIAKEDIINVRRLFLRMNTPTNRVFGLVTPEQWEDLLLIPEFVDFEKTGQLSKLKEGMIGRLLGIDFFVRQNPALNANVVYNETTSAKIEYQGAVAVTDTSAAIFWDSSLVRKSQGAAKIFLQNNDPVFKSDVFSTDARFGATKSRLDGVGVVSLIETATP